MDLEENCKEATKNKNTTTNGFDIRSWMIRRFFLSPFYSSFILPVSIPPIKGLLCFGILGKKSDARCFAASEILMFVKKYLVPSFSTVSREASVLSNRKSRLLFYWPPFSPFFLGMMGVAHFSSALRICMTMNSLNYARKMSTLLNIINKNTEIVLNMSHSTREHNVLSSFFLLNRPIEQTFLQWAFRRKYPWREKKQDLCGKTRVGSY